MKVELGFYEITQAVQEFIIKKYGWGCFDFEEMDMIELKYLEAVREPKKYKNGRLVKHPVHGYVETEIVDWHKKYINLDENSELHFFLDS